MKELFDNNKDEIAAVIVEPVAANMGVVLPRHGFLEFLRDITKENGSLLIFDEVITGFRLSIGGAQEYFNIKPDLTTLGKIVGGGMPVGAYGGRADIMRMVSPDGPVYQAGTLSGNPIATAAGLETLRILRDNKDIYDRLETKTKRIADSVRKCGAGRVSVNQIGSLIFYGTFGFGTIVAFLIVIAFIYFLVRPYKESDKLVVNNKVSKAV